MRARLALLVLFLLAAPAAAQLTVPDDRTAEQEDTYGFWVWGDKYKTYVEKQVANVDLLRTLFGNVGAGLVRRVFDVTEPQFGAVPDDGGDDAASIQDALDAAGKSCVVIPRGTYLLSSAIALTDGQCLMGAGEGTVLTATTNNQNLVEFRGRRARLLGMKLTKAAGVTGVKAIYINPGGDVDADQNILADFWIEGIGVSDQLAEGIYIRAGAATCSTDCKAFYTRIVNGVLRYAGDAIELDTIGTNTSNGANGTQVANVRVSDSTNCFLVTRADTAMVSNLACEGTTNGITIKDSVGADNNKNQFFGLRFEAITNDWITVEANSFYNVFAGHLDPDKISDSGTGTMLLSSEGPVDIPGFAYSNATDKVTLGATNGVDISGSAVEILTGTLEVGGSTIRCGTVGGTTCTIRNPQDNGVAAQLNSTTPHAVLFGDTTIRNTAGSQDNALITNNGIRAITPTAQTIAAGNTVTANACGGIKRISSAGAVTTDTTNTFTAPAAANTNCVMDVCNAGANNITLDNNALFTTAGGADLTLGADDCVRVGSDGAKWRQIAAVLAGS